MASGEAIQVSKNEHRQLFINASSTRSVYKGQNPLHQFPRSFPVANP